MTVNLQKLNAAKTIADLNAAGVTVDMIVGVCKTTYTQRAKQLDAGKENRALLAALKSNPELVAKLSAAKK